MSNIISNVDYLSLVPYEDRKFSMTYISAEINNTSVPCLIDTGSSYSIITLDLLKMLTSDSVSSKIQKTSIRLTSGTNEKIQVHGCIDLKLRIKNNEDRSDSDSTSYTIRSGELGDPHLGSECDSSFPKNILLSERSSSPTFSPIYTNFELDKDYIVDWLQYNPNMESTPNHKNGLDDSIERFSPLSSSPFNASFDSILSDISPSILNVISDNFAARCLINDTKHENDYKHPSKLKPNVLGLKKDKNKDTSTHIAVQEEYKNKNHHTNANDSKVNPTNHDNDKENVNNYDNKENVNNHDDKENVNNHDNKENVNNYDDKGNVNNHDDKENVNNFDENEPSTPKDEFDNKENQFYTKNNILKKTTSANSSFKKNSFFRGATTSPVIFKSRNINEFFKNNRSIFDECVENNESNSDEFSKNNESNSDEISKNNESIVDEFSKMTDPNFVEFAGNHEFIVATGTAVPCILGIDFMSKSNSILDYSTGKMIVNDTTLPIEIELYGLLISLKDRLMQRIMKPFSLKLIDPN